MKYGCLFVFLLVLTSCAIHKNKKDQLSLTFSVKDEGDIVPPGSIFTVEGHLKNNSKKVINYLKYSCLGNANGFNINTFTHRTKYCIIDGVDIGVIGPGKSIYFKTALTTKDKIITDSIKLNYLLEIVPNKAKMDEAIFKENKIEKRILSYKALYNKD